MVVTPYGSVLLHVADATSKFGRKLIFVQRHHADPGRPADEARSARQNHGSPLNAVALLAAVDVSYSLPHLINRRAIVAALRQEGVTKVIGFGSVGGLKEEFGPGTVSVCDDYFQLWTPMCLNNDASAHIGPPPPPRASGGPWSAC